MKILVLDDLAQTLAPINGAFKKKKCQTAYTKDPVLALKTLNKYKFDVVLCAQKIARTNVHHFIKAVSIKFPSLVRCAMIDENNLDSELSHLLHYQYTEDFDGSKLVNDIEQLATNKKSVAKASIVKMVSSVKTLPSPPKVFLQLNAILQNQNTDSEKIAQIVTQDPALAAKVLQFSNNTFMQNGKPLTNIADAITKMGVETLCCIVMTAELFSQNIEINNFSVANEQLHALAVARFAATLVAPELKNEALLAGLLHGIGKLVLYQVDDSQTQSFLRASRGRSDIIELEQQHFKADHCQIGAYLLHSWSFSNHTIESTLLHKIPSKLLKANLGVAQVVYIANTLINQQKLQPAFIEHYKLAEHIDNLTNKAARFIY